jgi:YjjG family noncanonical pyrimidine nucleotidase
VLGTIDVVRYSTILFDLDHTLFDTDRSEDLAFEHTLAVMGISGSPSPDIDLRATYDRINKALWAAVERHEITPVQVRTRRFEEFVVATGVDVDPVRMADAFVEGLASFGELYDGALDVVARLAEHCRIALITNGLGEVQRPRVRRVGLEPYLHAVMISGETGVSKPAAGAFDLTFDALGLVPDESVRHRSLIVGDSLSSDIRGGSDYGVATCWFNPKGAVRPAAPGSPRIDHDLRSLDELTGVVLDAAIG